MDDFGENTKPIALLFCEKWSFFTLFHCSCQFEMCKMDDFGEKTKPIALLFGEKWSYFWTMLKMDDFGENTKPIALLFGEIFSFLLLQFESVENGQFWGKYQAYSLTFL